MMAPKDIHTPTPGTCEWATFHGQRDFAGVMKAQDVEMGGCLLIVWVVPASHEGSYKWKRSQTEGDGIRKTDRRSRETRTWPRVADCEDRGSGHQPRKVGSLGKLD